MRDDADGDEEPADAGGDQQSAATGDGHRDDAADSPQGGDRADDATVADPGELRGHADDLEERVDEIARRADAARAEFEPPDDPEERALTYCREGLWPVLAVYVDRRGAGAPLGQPHHDRLEDALNTWLELYARCYGVEIDAAFSVREAAELFVSTHNVRDVAQLLTDVPERRTGA